MGNEATVLKQLRPLLAPPPDLSMSDWADQFRYLPKESSANPGRWRTDYFPPQKEIMDTISNPKTEMVVLMLSSQWGKSEIIVNTDLYYSHQDPSTVLLVQPTIKMSESFSKERLQTSIDASKELTELFFEAKSRDGNNSTLSKSTKTGSITNLAGANSPASLASRPVRVYLADEVDRWPPVLSEGDPFWIGYQRTANYSNRKIVVASTPTHKDTSRIFGLYQTTDQRVYLIQCPECEHEFFPMWGHVRWDQDDQGEHLPETARIECEACEFKITEQYKSTAVRKGRWHKRNEKSKTPGFHSNAIISPWTRLHELVEEFLLKKNDRHLFQTFVNLKLGDVFEGDGETLASSDFMTRVEDYEEHSLPNDILMLTAGVDVQADRLEMQVIGFSEKQMYVVQYLVLHGDTSTKTVWAELGELIKSSKLTRLDGVPLKLSATCVDSGYQTQIVYQFCRALSRYRVFPVKGRQGGGVPIWPKRKQKAGSAAYVIGTDTIKDFIFARLKIDNVQTEGYVHFNVNVGSEDYFKQLTSEKRKIKYTFGRPSFYYELPKGRRNEALDTFGYCIAAYHAVNPNFNYYRAQLKKIKQQKPPPEMPPLLAALNKEGKSFVQDY